MGKIIVTGAGTGLGAELAKRYALEGNHMILLGRTSKKLEKVVKQIADNGGKAEVKICDISNPQDVKEVIKDLTSKYNDIDCLINNAGVGYFGPLEEIDVEDISYMMDINVNGTIFMTREILPYFKKNKKGKILNIISTAGLRGKVNESAYVASKFAVRGFSESLQKELESGPITVTAVYMGGMNTPFWKDSTHVKDTSKLKSPKTVAELIFNDDDGRNEILIDR